LKYTSIRPDAPAGWPVREKKDISTTMEYYVGKEAETTADVIWAAVEKSGTISGTIRRKSLKN
jgi:hypothetical protein